MLEANPSSSLPALRLGREWQDRKRLPQGLVNDYFLPRLRQDFTHRFEIKAGPGDFRRFDKLLKHGAKSRDVPLGFIDALETITLRPARLSGGPISVKRAHLPPAAPI
jgi:hypothetical protein